MIRYVRNAGSTVRTSGDTALMIEFRTLNRPQSHRVKLMLAISHYGVGIVLGLPAKVAVIISRFTILGLERYPQGFFIFVLGAGRWALRVLRYAFLLVADRYPPFSLEQAEPSSARKADGHGF